MDFLIQMLMYIPPMIGVYCLYRGMKKKFWNADTNRLPKRAYLYIFLSFPVLTIIWNLFLMFVLSLLRV